MSQGFTKDYVVKATGESDQTKLLTTLSTTSGTAKDFTIPSGCKEFTVLFNKVSFAVANSLSVRLTVGGTLATSGYDSMVGHILSTNAADSGGSSTMALLSFTTGTTSEFSGHVTFKLQDDSTDVWSWSGNLSSISTATVTIDISGGLVDLSGECDGLRVRGSTDQAFDNGSVSVSYENPELAVSGIESVAAGVTDVLTNGTKTATTSGAAIDFTIPSGVKEIKVSLADVSLAATDGIEVQLGDSGGIHTTGYSGGACDVFSGGNPVAITRSTDMACGGQNGAAVLMNGIMHLVLHDAATNTWVGSYTGARGDSAEGFVGGSSVALDSEITTVRLKTDGTTFDGGSVNIQYETQDLDLGSGVISGGVVQTVHVIDGELATGAPGANSPAHDDSIPQNTEGTEFMTVSITPTDTANKLKIEVIAQISPSVATWTATWLNQDSVADALATNFTYMLTGTEAQAITFTYWMTAGTTSSTTFKVRAGSATSSTMTFNGQSGGRLMGGSCASSITITEYKV